MALPPNLPAVPTLSTARLTLRGHRLEDFGELAEVWSDPQMTRYVGGKPWTSEEVWARLVRYIGHWAALGFGFWVAQETTTGRYVGEVGFMEFKRELPTPLDAPEMGWSGEAFLVLERGA